jgi:hypothetical protein
MVERGGGWGGDDGENAGVYGGGWERGMVKGWGVGKKR